MSESSTSAAEPAIQAADPKLRRVVLSVFWC